MGSTADLIVCRLLDAGVRTLFGMPGGGSNLDLIAAAGRERLPFVLTATETGAALAAVGQADITGQPGACLTTLGPGVASVMNGVACAHLDRAPILVLTDCYGAAAGAAEHQRLDHRALMAPITKWSATLTASNADAVMTEALARATGGSPGPVHVDVSPDDSRGVTGDLNPTGGVGLSSGDSRLQLAVSSRPLLLVGLGARRPGDVSAVRAFCRTHNVPAMVTYKAKGVVADDDPYFAGVFTNAAIEQDILSQADLFIGVGLDPVELLPRTWPCTQPIVAVGRWRVDDRHVPFAEQVVADVASGLEQVGGRLSATNWDFDAVRRTVAAQRDALRADGDRLTTDRVVRIAAAITPGVRVAVDAGAHMFAATMLWPIADPNGMLISNGLSTMGFALPAAIGAALLDRDRPVVALTGDGGLLICAGELLTAAREGLRVVTIVLSDASLSLIAVKQQQRRLPAAGVALGDIAWCALAESLGVRAHAAATESELERALVSSMQQTGPSLIEVRVDPSAYAETLRRVRG